MLDNMRATAKLRALRLFATQFGRTVLGSAAMVLEKGNKHDKFTW